MRITGFFLVLLAALALTATVQAQEPTSTPEPTGSISGRLVFDGPQPEFQEGDPTNLAYLIWVIPADTPQPINLEENFPNLVMAEANGDFSVGGLADGDYFLFPLQGLVSSTPPPESISVCITGVDPSDRLAVRVTVANGQSVTGIEMVAPVPEPTPTPTPLPPGSISGRFIVEGEPGQVYNYLSAVVRADVPQPIPVDTGVVGVFHPDEQGNFIFSGLEDGDYFVLAFIGWEIVEPPGEHVLLSYPAGYTLAFSGLRVTVADGQAVTGLEIVVRKTGQGPPAPGQLSPVALAATGTGPGSSGRTTVYVLAVAALAVLLLAGGMAVRLRGDRRA